VSVCMCVCVCVGGGVAGAVLPKSVLSPLVDT
jgi:hypothetical protein